MKKKWLLSLGLLLSLSTLLISSSVFASNSNEELYKDVFADYKKIADTAANQTENGEKTANELYQQLNQSLGYWTIANIAYAPEKIVYSFRDLDGRREDELLIGVIQSDNSVVPVALHYLVDGEPELLVEGYTAAVGGERAGMTLLKDGKVLGVLLYSGTGKGTGNLYQLNPQGGKAGIVAIVNVELGKNPVTSNFGYTEEDILRMDELDWHPLSELDKVKNKKASKSSSKG